MSLPANAARLNPFTFLSDTGLRFALLLILAVFGSAKQWLSMSLVLTGSGGRMNECVGTARSMDVGELFNNGLPCLALIHQSEQVAFIAFGLLLLAFVTWAIWICYPMSIIRRAKLVPFDETRLPQVAAELDRLCRIAGLDKNPSFWWNPLDGRLGIARAFGHKGQPQIALSGGLVFQCLKHPDAFRTVLLHELGHLRNRDITVTYLALSVAWAYVATALLPSLLVVLTHRPDASTLLLTLGEVGSFALCLVLTRAAILRARELYADVRCSCWHPSSAEVSKAFFSLAPIPVWCRWLSSHPAPAKRKLLLSSTDGLFAPSRGEAFGIGASVGIVCVFGLSLMRDPIGNPAMILVPLLFSMPLAAGAIAIGIWRSAFLSLMRGEARAPIGHIAFATALGAISGSIVVPLLASGIGASGFADVPLPKIGESGPGLVLTLFALFIVLAAAGPTIALALTLAWVQATARYWMRASLLGSCPRGIAFAVCIASAIAATACIIAACIIATLTLTNSILVGVELELRSANPLAYFWLMWAALMNSPTASAVTWVAILALWALPLSARLWPVRMDVAPWAFLDDPPARRMATRPPARLLSVVGAGLFAGLLAVLVTFWLGRPLPVDPQRLRGVNPLLLWSHRLEAGICAQALVAGAVTIFEPVAALPPALLAAFVAGAVFAASELGQFYVGAGHAEPMIVQFVCSSVIFGGASLAFLTVQITGALIPTVGRRLVRSR